MAGVTTRTFNVFPYFAAGYTVSAYPVSNWPSVRADYPSGTPVGSAYTSGTVAADGTISLTLVNNTQYWLASNGSGSYVYVRAAGAQIGSDIKMAKVTNSGAISLAHAATVYLTFDTVLENNDGMFNPAANDRITIQTDGLYIVSAILAFSANNVGPRYAWIDYFHASGNFTSQPVLDYRTANANAADVTTVNLHAQLRMHAGDYVRVAVEQDSGTTLTCIHSTELPVFTASRIGP